MLRDSLYITYSLYTKVTEKYNNSDNMKYWKRLYDYESMEAFWVTIQFSSVHFSSVTPSCLTLCDPMDCNNQACLSIAIYLL